MRLLEPSISVDVLGETMGAGSPSLLGVISADCSSWIQATGPTGNRCACVVQMHSQSLKCSEPGILRCAASYEVDVSLYIHN